MPMLNDCMQGLYWLKYPLPGWINILHRKVFVHGDGLVSPLHPLQSLIKKFLPCFPWHTSISLLYTGRYLKLGTFLVGKYVFTPLQTCTRYSIHSNLKGTAAPEINRFNKRDSRDLFPPKIYEYEHIIVCWVLHENLSQHVEWVLASTHIGMHPIFLLQHWHTQAF
jgi:hypothetical protein